MFPFVEKRRIAYLIVGIILLAGIASYFIHGGFKLDIQFQGGTELKYKMANDQFDSAKAQALINKALNKTSSVVAAKSLSTSGATDNFLVVRVSSSEALSTTESLKVTDLLLKNDFQIGLDYSLQGNNVINYTMNDANYDAAKAQELINKATGINTVATAKKVADAKGNDVNLLVVTAPGKTVFSAADVEKVTDTLRHNDYRISLKAGAQTITNISPSIGAEIMRNGILAVLVALLLIIIYIAFRFKAISGWSAGVIASMAILSDALLMISVYLIFQISLNESFIAGVLTVIGYSINDKIIIYDRIRENSLGKKKGSYSEIVNLSIWQTLTRSINTAATAIMSLTVVFVLSTMFQIEAVAQFALPMIIGIAFGMLSSNFIAGPMLGAYKEANAKNNARTGPVKSRR